MSWFYSFLCLFFMFWGVLLVTFLILRHNALKYAGKDQWNYTKSPELMVASKTEGSSEQHPLKIDIVYLWVDGEDPKHKLKYQTYKNEIYGTPINLKSKSSRNYSCNELYYSILMSFKNMGELLGNVYIVTDEQTPGWIKHKKPNEHELIRSHWDRIHVIDQKTLIPEDMLPSFNSDVISAYIYKIPNLSEHFLYMCDDFFINEPMSLKHLFVQNEDGETQMRVYQDNVGVDPSFSKFVTLSLEKTTLARLYTDKLLRKKGYVGYHCLLAHAPHLISKSLFQKMMRDIGPFFHKHMKTHHFRHEDDIVLTSFFYPHYAVHQKKAVLSNDYYTFYYHLNDHEFINHIQEFLINRFSDRITFFCVNDARAKNFERTSYQVQEFLQSFTTHKK